jgi:hypothetical protein
MEPFTGELPPAGSRVPYAMHRHKLPLLLSGLLGSLAVLLAVACGGGSASTGVASTSTRAGSAQGVAAQPAQVTPGAAAKPAQDAVVPAVTPPEGSRVQRSARIALQVPNGRFDQTLTDVMTVVEQAGGYISGSDAQAPDDGQPLRTGQATFQVPSTSFEKVIGDIRKKGTAQTISISGNDVSQQYVDLQARLRNAEAQRDAILALMQQARSVADTIQIQNQLGQVTSQIEQLHGQIDYLDHSTAFSTVAVSIREVTATSPRDDWGLQTATSQAAHNLVAVLAFLILAIGTLIPVLVLGGVLFLVGRVAWRRFGPAAVRARAAAPAVE